MYGKSRITSEPSISLDVIEQAFEELNKLSIELTKLLSEYCGESPRAKTQEILVAANLMQGYMISVRNQLFIFKRTGGLSASAVAKDYLSELKVQMDSLKSIVYSYGAIFTAQGEVSNLTSKMN